MGQSGAQATAFFRDVVANCTVWTVQDDGGCPAPKTSSGQRSMPFWSSLSRVQKIISTVPAYGAMKPRQISVDEWTREWLPDLKKAGLLIGINWSGVRAVGWDFEVDDVLARLEAADVSRDTPQDHERASGKLSDIRGTHHSTTMHPSAHQM
jgi:hypothetical protein